MMERQTLTMYLKRSAVIAVATSLTACNTLDLPQGRDRFEIRTKTQVEVRDSRTGETLVLRKLSGQAHVVDLGREVLFSEYPDTLPMDGSAAITAIEQHLQNLPDLPRPVMVAEAQPAPAQPQPPPAQPQPPQIIAVIEAPPAPAPVEKDPEPEVLTAPPEVPATDHIKTVEVPTDLEVKKVKEALLTLTGTRDGLAPGARFFVRGHPEVFIDPVSGEEHILSDGAILGLAEVTDVGLFGIKGRLLSGIARPGNRLEPRP